MVLANRKNAPPRSRDTGLFWVNIEGWRIVRPLACEHCCANPVHHQIDLRESLSSNVAEIAMMRADYTCAIAMS
jgi:hypothetical protein